MGRRMQPGERGSEGESGREATLIPATSGGVIIDSRPPSCPPSVRARLSERQDQLSPEAPT